MELRTYTSYLFFKKKFSVSEQLLALSSKNHMTAAFVFQKKLKQLFIFVLKKSFSKILGNFYVKFRGKLTVNKINPMTYCLLRNCRWFHNKDWIVSTAILWGISWQLFLLTIAKFLILINGIIDYYISNEDKIVKSFDKDILCISINSKVLYWKVEFELQVLNKKRQNMWCVAQASLQRY